MDGSHGQVQDYEGPLTNEGLRISPHGAGMAYAKAPRSAWAILGLALLGVSSGGPLLASMPEVPPILRASWRLWATSLVLVPGLYVQRSWFIDHGYDLRSSSILAASGIALAIHFAAWTWSLDHTSLAHSLLFVTSHPIVIVSFMVLMMRRMDWVLVSGATGWIRRRRPRTPRCIPNW